MTGFQRILSLHKCRGTRRLHAGHKFKVMMAGEESRHVPEFAYPLEFISRVGH